MQAEEELMRLKENHDQVCVASPSQGNGEKVCRKGNVIRLKESHD